MFATCAGLAAGQAYHPNVVCYELAGYDYPLTSEFPEAEADAFIREQRIAGLSTSDVPQARMRALRAFAQLRRGTTIIGDVRAFYGPAGSIVEMPLVVFGDTTSSAEEVEEYGDGYTMLDRGLTFKPSLFPGDRRSLLATLGDQIVLGGYVPQNAVRTGRTYTWRTWTGAGQQFRVLRDSGRDFAGDLYYKVDGTYRLAAHYAPEECTCDAGRRLPGSVLVVHFGKNGKPASRDTYTRKVSDPKALGIEAIPVGSVVIDGRLGPGKEVSYAWTGQPKSDGDLVAASVRIHSAGHEHDGRFALWLACGGFGLFLFGGLRAAKARRTTKAEAPDT